MEEKPGYYTGCLELNGFKTPFVVYATSNENAVNKALKGVKDSLQGVIIRELEGPHPILTP